MNTTTTYLIKFVLTLLIISFWSSPLQANEITELLQRIEQLEKQVAKGDNKTNAKIDALTDELMQQNQRLRISGFATVSATKSDVDFGSADREFTEKLNYSTDTRAGLQADFKISDDWSATIQGVATAFDEWQTEVEWAFIKYQATNEISFRAGRLRLPLYYYSESLDVGFAYPWVRPPVGFYITSLADYEGADAHYRFYNGDFTHHLSLFVGATEGTFPNGITTSIEEIWGGNYLLNYQNFGFRLAFTKSDISIDFSNVPFLSFLGQQDDQASQYITGFMYTGENLYTLVELSYAESEWNVVREGKQSHATVGYQLGRWMPYATYSFTEAENAHKAQYPQIFKPINLENNSLGIRFDASANINIKFQYDYFYNLLNVNNFQGLKEGTEVYSVSINGIF